MIQFIFPYRKDSSSREKNLDKVLNFYTEKFPNEKFLVVEVGDEKTYKGNISSIFEKPSATSN